MVAVENRTSIGRDLLIEIAEEWFSHHDGRKAEAEDAIYNALLARLIGPCPCGCGHNVVIDPDLLRYCVTLATHEGYQTVKGMINARAKAEHARRYQQHLRDITAAMPVSVTAPPGTLPPSPPPAPTPAPASPFPQAKHDIGRDPRSKFAGMLADVTGLLDLRTRDGLNLATLSGHQLREEADRRRGIVAGNVADVLFMDEIGKEVADSQNVGQVWASRLDELQRIRFKAEQWEKTSLNWRRAEPGS